MILVSTQPLSEMSTRVISWGGKGGRCLGLTTLLPTCADCKKSREPVQACNGRACFCLDTRWVLSKCSALFACCMTLSLPCPAVLVHRFCTGVSQDAETCLRSSLRNSPLHGSAVVLCSSLSLLRLIYFLSHLSDHLSLYRPSYSSFSTACLFLMRPLPPFILKPLPFWLLPSFWLVLERSELRYNITTVCSQPVCRDTAMSLYQRTVA